MIPRRRCRHAAMATAAIIATAAGLLAGLGSPAAAVCTSFPSGSDPYVLKTVYRVGLNLGVSERVMLAGFEAGWVESHMNNLPCGDRDSLGVFQQRPSQGWGTPEQVQNVRYAASAFFTRAVASAAQNPGYTAGQVAQSVQRAAYPERYDQAQSTALGLIAQAKVLAAFARDFTSDAQPDLLARRDTGNLYLYRGGSGVLLTPPVLIGSWPGFDIVAAASDFDRDGRADMFARSRASGILYLYRGAGNGTFYGGVSLGDWGGFSTFTGVGDWDGDGKADLVGRSQASGLLYLYRGNGGTGLLYPGVLLSGSNWSGFAEIVGAGDFDRDGNPDLFARSAASGYLYLYRGGNQGGLQAAVHIGDWGGFSRLVGAGDWNGDGRPDLVSRSTASGILYLYRGTGSGGLAYPATVLQASDWNSFDIVA